MGAHYILTVRLTQPQTSTVFRLRSLFYFVRLLSHSKPQGFSWALTFFASFVFSHIQSLGAFHVRSLFLLRSSFLTFKASRLFMCAHFFISFVFSTFKASRLFMCAHYILTVRLTQAQTSTVFRLRSLSSMRSMSYRHGR